MPLGSFGAPISGAAALGEELRRSLPPTLVEALDKIGDRIRVEILDPLLCANSDEDLAATFEGVFPKFLEYYVQSIQILQGSLQEDVQRLSALTIRGFRDSEDLIRASGAKWMGQPATLNALQGLSTVAGIAKAAIRRWQEGSAVGIGTERAELERWAKSLISYWMAYAAVHASLTTLTSGHPTSARLDNVALLANRSNRHALEAYHLSKVIGLLKVTPFKGPVDHGDEEDIILANTGLEDYVEELRKYDKQ
jgi:hypothetical protein